MDSLANLGDILGLIAFAAAVLVTIATPSSEGSTFNPTTKGIMIAAFGTYVYVTGAKVLGDRLAGTYIENFDDYIEVLFPVLVLMAVFAAYSHQQMLDLQRSQRAVKRSYDMMLEIVDAAASGMMLLDSFGRITFANDTARAFLDLGETPDTGQIQTPGWTVKCGDQEPADDFRGLLLDGRSEGIPVAVVWPKGWRVDLRVSVSPLSEDSGRIGGYVASFERPSRI